MSSSRRSSMSSERCSAAGKKELKRKLSRNDRERNGVFRTSTSLPAFQLSRSLQLQFHSRSSECQFTFKARTTRPFVSPAVQSTASRELYARCISFGTSKSANRRYQQKIFYVMSEITLAQDISGAIHDVGIIGTLTQKP